MNEKGCPTCKTALVRRYCGKVEALHCPKCGGFWIQKNRIGKILQRYMHYIARRHDRSCGRRQRANPRKIDPAKLECPQCARPMAKLNYAYNSNVIVDACDSCGGVWFDRGELERVADFLKNCGLPQRIKQEFEEIRTLYDHYDRQEALDLLKDAVVWILSFVV